MTAGEGGTMSRSSQSRLVDVEAELVRFLYRNSPTSVAVNVTLALLLSIILYQHVETSRVSLWISLIVVISCLRFIQFWQFRRRQPGDADMPRWRQYFLVGALLSAAGWGFSPWLFAPYDGLAIPILLAFTLGGLMAGAAAILGAVLKVYVSFSLTIMLPIIVWFLLQSDPVQLTMGAMLVVATAAMISNGVIYRRMMRDSYQLSNDLHHAKNEAEQANRAKSQFLSRMSHELRTPLSSILGYAQLVQERQQKPSEEWSYLDEIVNATDHLVALINDLLDLSRIENRTVELQHKTVACEPLIIECLQRVEALAAEHEVQLRWQADSETAEALCDPLRLQQIVLNVLTNICTYARGGGEIIVRAQLLAGMVVISFEDRNGCIPQRHYDKIFLTYHRLGREDSAVEGTGLGLTLIKQLIALMDGDIGVTADAPSPTRFWISLPAA
ncbi:MAG: hypothetical protein Tsb002_10030 [Wenzhouxiangellaceae bacterium]